MAAAAARKHPLRRLLLWPGSGGSVRMRLAFAGLAACACLSVLSLLQLLGQQRGLLRGASGRAFHPALCGPILPSSREEASARGAGAAGAVAENARRSCAEVHDPRYALTLVTLPAAPDAPVWLASGDAALTGLQRQLAAAVERGWSLPLARRLVRVMLNHFSLDGSFDAEAPPVAARHSSSPQGWRFLQDALSLLAQRGGELRAAGAAGQRPPGGGFVPCRFDTSLPVTFQARFLFSASLGQAGQQLPNALLQLLHVLALLPPGSAYVALHVAPSADDTLFWVELLQLLLVPLGVPMHLEVAPGPHDPVQALRVGAAARGRNAALSPFFPRRPAAPPPPAGGTEGGGSGRRLAGAGAGAGGGGGSRRGGPVPFSDSITHGGCPPGRPRPDCFAPEWVVFVDAVYFCAADVVRLMEYPEDLACAVQLEEGTPFGRQQEGTARRRRLQQQEQQGEDEQQQQDEDEQQQQQQEGQQERRHQRHRRRTQRRRLAVAAAAGSSGALRRLRQSAVLGEGPMARAAAAAAGVALRPDIPPEFLLKGLVPRHDALRDVQGALLSARAPYFSHPASVDAARAGLPLPVYCCWGGLAKMRAAPLAAGLRFRAALPGECNATETSLMCDDMRRAGFPRIVLDAGVRTAAALRPRQLLANPRFPSFYYTKWETTAWFDVNPLLPLKYWDDGAAAVAAAQASPDAAAEAAQVAAQAALWAPGAHHACCEARLSAARPSPDDCSTVPNAGGTNFTAHFLAACAAGGGGGGFC